jgi:hypothetical protein
MKHRTEEELIAFREGHVREREEIAAHLRECAQCRAEMERIEAVYTAMDMASVPEPGDEFERRMWQKIAPRLEEKKASWWEVWLAPRRLALAGAVAVLVVLAFYVGRKTGPAAPAPGVVETADASKVRERVLIVAVGEHLGRSEMVLMELQNAATAPGQKTVSLGATQRRAEDLVEENRLYRETALQAGDQAMASTLDQLERALLDIANSPQEVTPAQFEALRKRIEAQGLLFKVRVVQQGLEERTANPEAKPAENQASHKERNKA